MGILLREYLICLARIMIFLEGDECLPFLISSCFLRTVETEEEISFFTSLFHSLTALKAVIVVLNAILEAVCHPQKHRPPRHHPASPSARA